MKLKYRFELDTIARDDTRSLNSLIRHVNDCDVEFLFDNDYRLIAINVLIPKARITYNPEGKVQPLDRSIDEKARIIADYVVNVLHEETGKCDVRKMPDTPEYVPETTEDQKELEGKIFTRTKSYSVDCILRGQYDYSENTLNKYIKLIDPFAMYSDARRMSNPVGKYREFFRVLEYFFPFNGSRFDKKASEYFRKYSSGWTREHIYEMRQLRHRCTHAKKDYITSNDLTGMEQVRRKLAEIQQMSKILLDNPP